VARTHRRDARVRDRDREHEPDGETDSEPEPAGERESGAPGQHRPAVLRGPLRPGLRRQPVAIGTAATAPVAKGGRVRVLEGPFAGKVGVVQELDGKGGARVMLGLLAVRIDVKHLVAWTDGRARPRLSSSHRKPVPVRS
jgi:hypothetical protein